MPTPTREEMERKYGDIIHAERPRREEILRKHPKMSNGDRAKIFAPFAALRGHSDRLLTEDGKRLRQRKMELSEYEADILSDKLSQVKKGINACVLYFLPDAGDMGYYMKLEGKVTEFDPVFRKLKIEKTTIAFDDILDVFGENIISLEWNLDTEEAMTEFHD